MLNIGLRDSINEGLLLSKFRTIIYWFLSPSLLVDIKISGLCLFDGISKQVITVENSPTFKAQKMTRKISLDLSSDPYLK